MDMAVYRVKIKSASNVIRSRIDIIPEVCVVLGSGLSSLADILQNRLEIPYSDIPGFPEVTVAGHEGLMIFGSLSGIPVMLLKGRFHYYEGHPIEDVVFPVRVMRELGIKTVILTNAAGGVNRNYNPGDLMIIRDHIGLFCESTLRGENMDEYGPRFPDQTYVYSWKKVLEYANELNIPAHAGVYCYAKGPMYETPAEIRFIAALGADAVGMSTVPEAIAAVHGGMKVIGISTITNFAAGILDQPLSHTEVLEVGLRASEGLKRLIIRIIEDK
ncbi:MAG: purine-nucleoside phosphorylase [Saccharofermentanales bacterium]